MGHSSIATTQRYYCDKDQKTVASEMVRFWDAHAKNTKKEGD